MKCRDCFYHRAVEGLGIDPKTLKTSSIKHYCHRFPKKIEVESSHWCGEHLNKDGKKKTSQYLADKAFLEDYNKRRREGGFITDSEHERHAKIMKGNPSKA